MATQNTTTANKSKKTAAPAKRQYVRSAERFNIVGANDGDKVKFYNAATKKWATGTLLYCKASNRHPQGRAYIQTPKGKIVKRVLEHVQVIDVALPA